MKCEDQFKMNNDSIKVISRLQNGIRAKNSEYFSVLFRLVKPYSYHDHQVMVKQFKEDFTLLKMHASVFGAKGFLVDFL